MSSGNGRSVPLATAVPLNSCHGGRRKSMLVECSADVSSSCASSSTADKDKQSI